MYSHLSLILILQAIAITGILSIVNSTPSATMAYSCSSSASTNNLHNRGAGVSGSSGSCSTSSASTSSSRLGGVNVNNQGPITVGLLSITRTTHGVWEEILSTSSGGAQSSCSSSSATGSHGLTLTSNSISQAGHCP
jgi:hypothetical protein